MGEKVAGECMAQDVRRNLAGIQPTLHRQFFELLCKPLTRKVAGLGAGGE